MLLHWIYFISSPGCTLEPSHADIEVTKRLYECSKSLDVAVFDHLILTKDGYFFEDQGLM